VPKIKTATLILITAWAVLLGVADVRNFINPLGYWVAWLSLTLIGLVLLIFKYKVIYLCMTAQAKILILFYTIGFIVFTTGFALSFLNNSNEETIQQAVKLLIVYLVGLVILLLASQLNPRELVGALVVAIIAHLIIFFAIKYSFPFLHIQSGDGRQGSLLSQPGTLWKSGYFFALFLLAHWLSNKKCSSWIIIGIVSGVFLVMLDGSRTGLFLLAASLLVILTLRLFSRVKYLKFHLLFTIFISFVVVTYIGFGVASGGGHDVNMIAVYRGFQDQARMAQFSDGFSHAGNCWLLGCGFYSTIGSDNVVVHNAYIALLGDIGIFGLLGFLIILLSPILLLIVIHGKKNRISTEYIYLNTAIMLSVLSYAFLMQLHSFSTEMSEWGFFIFALAFLMAKKNENPLS